jgi:hypothetical protein
VHLIGRQPCFALALTLTLVVATSIANPSLAQEQASSPATTGVMVIVTVKAGVTREQVMATMPAEIQQTVQLYLNGKIREWYSRSDGRGVVLLLDTKDVAEAHAIMDGLPLGKQATYSRRSARSQSTRRTTSGRPGSPLRQAVVLPPGRAPRAA